jgi:hypothetical protein
MSALREVAWHDDGSRRWGSAYDFTQKLTRFIGRIEADRRALAPNVSPLPGLPQANPQTKASNFARAVQLRASLLSRVRA